MKFDRLQIKLTIGLIFVAILYVVILLVEPKANNNNNTAKTYQNKVSNNTQFTGAENTENKIIEKNEELLENTTKDEIFSLIGKGLENPFNVETFIYSTEFLNDSSLSNIYFEGQYEDIIEYINVDKYRSDSFRFTSLRNTENYIWGYFLEEGKEQNEKTFLIIDKLSGRIQALNDKNRQIIIYFEDTKTSN